MKVSKWIMILIGLLCLVSADTLHAQSIDPVSLIIGKVIKALDLKVQQLQNETLVLQQVEQAAQTELSKTKLAEITNWQQQLANLYSGYFAELRQVKSSIAGSGSVKKILALQKEIVFEYGRMAKEPSMKWQYDQLLNSSVDILQTLQMILNSPLSMRDSERICMIQALRDSMDHCLFGIQSLNKQQWNLITNRNRMQADLQWVKRLNGIQ